MVGLPADRPIILYTGSSVFIARSELEAPFARRWIESLRASGDPMLASASILIRPHPFNCDGWMTTDFSGLGAVAVFPRARYTPSAESARDSFFHSLYFASAVVGVNTSAMVEAAILRKPVLSLLAEEFSATQEGTLHFHYLLPENGGFLRVAQSLTQHVGQLIEVLRNPGVTDEETERFVRAFLRPHGLATACTPLLADAFQRRAEQPRPPVRDALSARLMRLALWPLALMLTTFSGLEGGLFTTRRLLSVWNRLGKSSRAALKLLVVRPGRAVAWVLRRVVALARRGGRRLAYWVLTTPRRALRLARHVRYHVAVRMRGDGQA